MSQLRAQSISVMVSNRQKCNARCKGCISASTQASSDYRDFWCDPQALRKGLRYAERLGATHAILTSKSEPTLEPREYLCGLVESCSAYLPLVDIHTNGTLLQPGGVREGLLSSLEARGLTMVTYSIADHRLERNTEFMGTLQNVDYLVRTARDLGLLVRCSVLLTKETVQDVDDLWDYIRFMGDLGVHQIVVRELWTPSNFDPTKCGSAHPYLWSLANKVSLGSVEDDFWLRVGHVRYGLHLEERDPLPWGQRVYAVHGFANPNHGVGVSFARCDEGQDGKVIKSIVHKPDGHGYRAWDSNADILY